MKFQIGSGVNVADGAYKFSQVRDLDWFPMRMQRELAARSCKYVSQKFQTG